MAHPHFHSLSSVRKFQGKQEDYIKIHSWFDATKSHFADFRHRSLRHHVEGVKTVCGIFGETVLNSDGINVPVTAIGIQHVVEDCSSLVNAADWANAITPQRWMEKPAKKTFEPQRRWRGKPIDYHFVAEFFTSTLPYLTNHSAGCFDLENKFGYTMQNSDGNPVPVRTLAEEFLQARYGMIPTPMDWLKHMRVKPWMVVTQKIEREIK